MSTRLCRISAVAIAVAIVAAATSCGQPTPDLPDVPVRAGTAPHEARPPQSLRAGRPAPDSPEVARIDALLAAWIAATTGDGADGAGAVTSIDERFALESSIVAAGDPAMLRLFEWFDGPDDTHRTGAQALLPLFGDAAAGGVLERIRSGDDEALQRAGGLGRILSAHLDSPEIAENLCRALFERARRGTTDGEIYALEYLHGWKPAARCIAADLARWVTDGQAGDIERAGGVLRSLRADAAPAAPVLAAWLRKRAQSARPANPDDDHEPGEGEDGDAASGEAEAEAIRRAIDDLAWDVLGELGPEVPAVLPDLRSILGASHPEAALRAAWVLTLWGDSAAPAVPELVALLASASGGARIAAAAALARIPSAWPAARERVVAVLADPSPESRLEWTGRVLAPSTADPLFVARVLDAAAAAEDEDVLRNLANVANYWTLDPSAAGLLAEILVRRPEPGMRTLGVRAWADRRASAGDVPSPASVPPSILALLDDPDAGVRFAAARALAGRGAVPAERIAVIAAECVALPEWEHFAALDLLAETAPGDPRLHAALLADLDDPLRCLMALRRLADSALVVSGRHPVAVEAAVAAIVERRGWSAGTLAAALVRIEGGADALVAAVQEWLRHDRGDFTSILDEMVAALGPRAAPLRDEIARARAALAIEYPSALTIAEFDRALAAIDADPQAMALTANSDHVVPRLLEMGAAGRRAVVLRAGVARLSPESLPAVAPARLDEEIVAAAAARAETDPYARERRAGAARLAMLLPRDGAQSLLAALEGDPAESVRRELPAAWLRVIEAADGAPPAISAAADALRRLSRDADPGVRGAVIEAWTALADERPEAMHVEDVAPFLDAPDAGPGAFRLAGLLRERGRSLLPLLRGLRDRSVLLRLDAARAIWRIHGDEGEALATVRSWMAEPHVTELWERVSWTDAGEFVASLPFVASDVPALVSSLRRCHGHPLGWIRALERLGPASAPAVPQLRVVLRRLPPGDYPAGRYEMRPDYEDTDGEAAARALAAIGSAAAAAIPDLRWRIANVGDERGVLEEAIRQLR